MVFKAIIAFVTLPVIVAFVVPIFLIYLMPKSIHPSLFGVLIILVGLLFLAWCARDFYIKGRGTLAPWAPPEKIVVVGLYRFVRNPMYVSVLFILIGWCLLTFSLSIVMYAALIFLAFHIRVVKYEEPWLQKNFSSEWHDYSQKVNRWLPFL